MIERELCHGWSLCQHSHRDEAAGRSPAPCNVHARLHMKGPKVPQCRMEMGHSYDAKHLGCVTSQAAPLAGR